ncbi:MAG: hypothetical protein ACQESE_00020 [Nanobdellota archaeon]
MARKTDEYSSEFVKLGGSIGGLMIATIVVFLIFASGSLEILVPLAWAFVVLGIVLGFFQYKAIATSSKQGSKK